MNNNINPRCKIRIEDFFAAPVISADTETDVSYGGSEQSGSFKFTPESDGEYVFSSAGDSDTYVTVLDSTGYRIAYDDDNGDGKVNNKDLTRLFQYLSDWDVEIH